MIVAIATRQGVAGVFVIGAEFAVSGGKGAIERIVASPADQVIGAEAAKQVVIAIAALDRVIALGAIEQVIALCAIHLVGPVATMQQVMTKAAIDQVVPLVAVKLVIAFVTEDGVAAFVPEGQVVVGTARDAVIASPAGQGIRALLAEELIHARAPAQDVVARAAIQQVVAIKTIDGIVAARTVERVIAAGSGQRVIAIGRTGLVLFQLNVVHGDAGRALQEENLVPIGEDGGISGILVGFDRDLGRGVTVITHEDRVHAGHEIGKDRNIRRNVCGRFEQIGPVATDREVALAQNEGIVPFAAEDGICPFFAINAVVPGATVNRVIACVAEDLVIAVAAHERIVIGIPEDRIIGVGIRVLRGIRVAQDVVEQVSARVCPVTALRIAHSGIAKEKIMQIRGVNGGVVVGGCTSVTGIVRRGIGRAIILSATGKQPFEREPDEHKHQYSTRCEHCRPFLPHRTTPGVGSLHTFGQHPAPPVGSFADTLKVFLWNKCGAVSEG